MHSEYLVSTHTKPSIIDNINKFRVIHRYGKIRRIKFNTDSYNQSNQIKR